MNSIYTHQAKATERFGVEFRSKLEAQWAYAFTELGWQWEYVDKSWYDFLVDGIYVEIKPRSDERSELQCPFFLKALDRAKGKTDYIVVILGNPKSPVLMICQRNKDNGHNFDDQWNIFRIPRFFNMDTIAERLPTIVEGARKMLHLFPRLSPIAMWSLNVDDTICWVNDVKR